MSTHKPSTFARYLLQNLQTKRDHLAVFRMWCEEKSPPECQQVFGDIMTTTSTMIDLIVEALRREGEDIPPPSPDPHFIAEARKQPNSRSRLGFAEQFLRRSLAWYEERLSEARSPEERALWDQLFTLETSNWAKVEDYLSP